ncbi:Ger(x)C family spore germination protein [Paenibacillus sp. B2(2019)]|uniref:Ger(x)C family spore germination protein n=1 Tax=Paenibacillus sp. B2(2019) TaxID=2607754 RepID=UPI0011F20EB4|nr:Ger(x)C family spore germination protein [Paenibacillus sp. B2(2019)]KAA1181925.1 Ger(x)C family spore germination protein [Paenibacillus sp. B2(2019)]
MGRRMARLCLSMVMIALLTGCWDSRELTDIGFVVAMAIDKGETKNIRVTVQIVNPINVSSTQGGGSPAPLPPTTYSAEGNNVFDATRVLSRKLSRQLHYGHAVVLLVGEELATTQGIKKLFDGIERDSEFRPSATMVIARGTTGEEIIKQRTSLDNSPAIKIKKMVAETEKAFGENIDEKIYQVIQAIVSSGKEPTITGIQLDSTNKEDKLMANGIATFKDGKLMRWLDGNESRGFLWVLGRVNSTLLTMDWNDQPHTIGIENIRTKSSFHSSFDKSGKPIIEVKIGADANIGEVDVPIDITNPRLFLQIERLYMQAVHDEAVATIKLMQQQKSDIFGFGEVVHRDHPKQWRTLKRDWNDVTFPTIEVKVKVEAYLRNTGLRNRTIMESIDNS